MLRRYRVEDLEVLRDAPAAVAELAPVVLADLVGRFVSAAVRATRP